MLGLSSFDEDQETISSKIALRVIRQPGGNKKQMSGGGIGGQGRGGGGAGGGSIGRGGIGIDGEGLGGGLGGDLSVGSSRQGSVRQTGQARRPSSGK